MTQKYFIGKCGGEDCMFRTGVILGEHQCLKDIEKCSKERCKNCPHGKTMEEIEKIGGEELYNICGEIPPMKGDSFNITILGGRFITAFKALLGGGSK